MSHKPSQAQRTQCEFCPHRLITWEEWERNQTLLPAEIQELEMSLSRAMSDATASEFAKNLLKLIEYLRFSEAVKLISDKTAEPRLYGDALKQLEGRIYAYRSKGR